MLLIVYVWDAKFKIIDLWSLLHHYHPVAELWVPISCKAAKFERCDDGRFSRLGTD